MAKFKKYLSALILGSFYVALIAHADNKNNYKNKDKNQVQEYCGYSIQNDFYYVAPNSSSNKPVQYYTETAFADGCYCLEGTLKKDSDSTVPEIKNAKISRAATDKDKCVGPDDVE